MRASVKAVSAVICLLLAPALAGGAVAQDGNLPITKPGGETILTLEQLQALAQHELTEQPTNFPKASRFRGPLLADVLAAAQAASKGAKLTAADDYQVTITAEEIAQHDPILALELDGQPLVGHDFGPYWVMWPFSEKPEIDNEAFQAKAIWQVVKIEVQ